MREFFKIRSPPNLRNVLVSHELVSDKWHSFFLQPWKLVDQTRVLFMFVMDMGTPILSCHKMSSWEGESQIGSAERCPITIKDVLFWNRNIFCLKCIWNEIFDNDFIGPFESSFKDKTIAVYRLLISGLDRKLWRSEVVKIVNFRVQKWQEIGHKINKNWSNLWRHNVYMSNRWLFKWL